jgi:hypothetical protein
MLRLPITPMLTMERTLPAFSLAAHQALPFSRRRGV